MRFVFRHHHLIPLGAATVLLVAVNSASAAVQINIDKNTQTMTVAVDGVRRWSWPVSSGLPNHETPNGTFKAFRMEADHFSKEWDDAPMPHSIFFTKQGHAIHGTDASRRLGVPASHGCVRLSRDNAAKLYALVEEQGVLNTTVTLTGSSQVALARGVQPSAQVANARQPLGIAPPVQGDDGIAANDPADYQRVPPARGYDQPYQQPYQNGAPAQTYRPRDAYVARGYVQQPYAQQGYAQQGYAQQYPQQGGYYPQQQRGYYVQSYPNYPGYDRGPESPPYGN